MLLSAIGPQSRKKPWLVVGFAIFALSLPTLWADTSAEIGLLSAAKAHFEGDIKSSEEKLFRNIANGLTTNFRTDSTDEDYSLNAENSPANAAGWGDDRIIRGDRLAWLFTSADATSHVTFHGVVLVGALVRGKLDISRTKVTFPFVAKSCVFEERIDLTQTTVRELNLTGSLIKRGLEASYASVEHDIFLGFGFVSDGKIYLSNTTIGGDLNCDSGNLVCERGESGLEAYGANIRGAVLLRKGFRAQGTVSFTRATIGGDLNCDSGNFAGEGGPSALWAYGANIQGAVMLVNGFRAKGTVSFRRATIGGDLNCDSGNFVSEGGESALDVYDANIQGAVLLRKGFRAKGTVSLKRAKIAGDLNCDSGNFVGEGGASALDASNTEIGGELTLANGFTAEGLVDLSFSHVTREFVLNNVRAPDRFTINLQFAKVGTLSNSKHSWPKKGDLSLLGFVYDQIDPNAQPDARIQIQWIHRQRDEFYAQPYNQLATALRRMGRDEEANVALVAKNRDDGRHRKEPWDAIWYKGLGKLIGFGYRPWNALFVSFGVIAIGTVLFGIGFRKEIVTPTSDAAFGAIRGSQQQLVESYPRFNAFIYSLETFVPIVKFEVAQYWIPNANRGANIPLGRFAFVKTGGLLRAYLWLHITLGWILTTIWVGGFTGLLKT